MAKSYALTTGDGVLATVVVSFPYISRDHVRLYFNGVEVPFSWINTGLILAATPPEFGASVLVRRVTPRDVALVDYADGDILTAFDLDLDSAQALFVAQEAHDSIELGAFFVETYDGAYSVVGNKRLTNVGYPEGDTDAATKLYVDRVAGGLETPVENAVTAAQAAAAAALLSAGASATAATASADSAEASATSAAAAAVSESDAGESAAAALAQAGLAATSANDAGDSASAAAVSATSASTSASNAATSATASDTAKIAAQTAKSGAESARDTAVTAKDTAVSSAATASTKATDAANSATAAGTSASAASTSASTANTRANDAAASATASQASAVTATASAAATYPATFEDGAKFFRGGIANYTFPVVSGVGTVARQTTGNSAATEIFLGRNVPLRAGRKHRITVSGMVSTNSSNGNAPRTLTGFLCYNSAGTYQGFYASSYGTPRTVATGQFEDAGGSISTETIKAAFPSATYIIPTCNPLWNDVGAVSSETRVDMISVAYSDETQVDATAASASAASASAASASTSAASASSSATVAATVGRGAMNANPTFANWPTAGSLPPYVGAWNAGSWTRVAGAAQTSPYAYRDAPAAGTEGGPYVTGQTVAAGAHYVMAAEFTLESGTLVGAGITFGGIHNFPFSSHPDSDGNTLGAGVVGRTYFFSRMFKIASDGIWTSHGMTAWVGFGQSIAAPRVIVWRQLYLRPATDAEVAAGKALVNTGTLQASVTTLAAADVDINGRLNASYALQVNGGGRITGMKLLSDGTTRSVVFDTDEFEIGDGTASRKPFRVAGGRVEINEALIRNLQVYPNDAASIAHRVAVLPKLYSGADGASITFPGTYGSGIPYIKWAGGTPPALATGESFEIVPVGAGPTGFTVRAKKFLPGTTTTQTASAGSNVGGSPQWRAHKPTAQDADAGRYFYRISGTAVLASLENLGTDEAPAYRAEYVIDVELWYRPAGGAWAKARTESVWLSEDFGSPSVPGTKTFSNVDLVVDLPAIGQDSDHEFGVSRATTTSGASITAFPQVRYNTTSTSSVTALSGEWTFEVLPPT